MFSIGVDVGQAVDHTAIAVIEKTDYLDLRHLERLPLGLSYLKMTDRLFTVHGALPGSKIILDFTGVGSPVADILRDKGAVLVPVSITGGKEAHCVDGVWRVPKRELVRGLVTALETGLLRIAKGLPYAEILKAELQDFEVRFTDKGNTTFDGATEHDDMVIAAALAVWGLSDRAFI